MIWFIFVFVNLFLSLVAQTAFFFSIFHFPHSFQAQKVTSTVASSILEVGCPAGPCGCICVFPFFVLLVLILYPQYRVSGVPFVCCLRLQLGLVFSFRRIKKYMFVLSWLFPLLKRLEYCIGEALCGMSSYRLHIQMAPIQHSIQQSATTTYLFFSLEIFLQILYRDGNRERRQNPVAKKPIAITLATTDNRATNRCGKKWNFFNIQKGI